jgi:hypothetical protein
VTGIEPALSAWEASRKLGSPTPSCYCDQEKELPDSAALPLRVENWVENRRCPECVQPGAAQCRLRESAAARTALLMGHQPWPASAARPIITAKSCRRQAQNVAARTSRARAGSRPGHLSAGAFLPLRAIGPVIRLDRPAGMDGPFSGRVALITGASGGTGQALARHPATGGACRAGARLQRPRPGRPGTGGALCGIQGRGCTD